VEVEEEEEEDDDEEEEEVEVFPFLNEDGLSNDDCSE